MSEKVEVFGELGEDFFIDKREDKLRGSTKASAN